MPLKTLPVGQSSYALSNSVVRFAVGKLILSTDVMLAEECPNKKFFVGRGHGHVVATLRFRRPGEKGDVGRRRRSGGFTAGIKPFGDTSVTYQLGLFVTY